MARKHLFEQGARLIGFSTGKIFDGVQILQTRAAAGAGKQMGRQLTFPVKRHITEGTIPMKQKWHGHSAFRIEAGEAKILIDPFLSDNPSRDDGWSGCLIGTNSTQGGDR